MWPVLGLKEGLFACFTTGKIERAVLWVLLFAAMSLYLHILWGKKPSYLLCIATNSNHSESNNLFV